MDQMVACRASVRPGRLVISPWLLLDRTVEFETDDVERDRSGRGENWRWRALGAHCARVD